MELVIMFKVHEILMENIFMKSITQWREQVMEDGKREYLKR